MESEYPKEVITLISLWTGHDVTGGYQYNANIARELHQLCTTDYITFPAYKTAARQSGEAMHGSDSHVLVDSIFFAYPKLLKELISGLSGKACTLLVHWLPWLEEKLIKKDLKEAGLAHLPGPPIGERSLKLLQLFDAFITTSRFTAGKLIENGIREERICTAPAGIEDSLMSIRERVRPGMMQDEGTLQFVTAAHWTPVKGVHRILPMLENLRRRQTCCKGALRGRRNTSDGDSNGRHFIWHSIGNRKEETDYGHYLNGLTLSGEINFPYRLHGALPPENCWEIIASCDCLLVPSILETYSMTAAEAVALGVPVVGFDTGGLSEAVSNGNEGYLCRSKEEYINILERWSKNPDLLAGMKQTCYKKPVRAWKTTAETIYEFLAKL